MLEYLDNFLSSAPGRDTTGLWGGLNENYARELLELHTLGVDGGYTQKDVIEVARAFTGWGIPTRVLQPSAARPVAMVAPELWATGVQFDAWRHDEGPKVVLGRVLPAGRGLEDGLEVIDLLAHHPSTARHIAFKLVQHFVADDPPLDLVDELAQVFLNTDGDLREVTRALFTSDAFYRREFYRAKAKRPFEFIVSALRVTGANLSVSGDLFRAWPTRARRASATNFGRPWLQLLQQMQHLPYAEPAPTGYSTMADDWMSAGALLQRINFALDFAFRGHGATTIDPFSVLGIPADSATALLDTGAGQPAPPAGLQKVTDILLKRLLYGASSPELAGVITEDLAKQRSNDLAELLARAIALLLGSPEFQRY
jgi:uncharacterized protein (DUF1800 family)